MPLEEVLVVIDLESDTPNDVLGIYLRTDDEGDVIAYNEWETGSLEWAPADCVEVRPGYIEYRGPGGLRAREVRV